MDKNNAHMHDFKKRKNNDDALNTADRKYLVAQKSTPLWIHITEKLGQLLRPNKLHNFRNYTKILSEYFNTHEISKF